MNEQRRARALAAMADAGLDALILGREANARYVSGARRLWLANARAFAPGCVLAASGDVHLLSTSDDGIPADIALDHLYPITWNPANLMARLARVPALAAARRIGVDSLTPFLEAQLSVTFPNAELHDGQTPMLAARREKLAEETDAIRRACAVARTALDEVLTEMVPGTRERDLLARFEQRMCELGTTTPAFEGTFGHTFPSERVLETGDRVVLDVGVLVDGYEGGLARTIVWGSVPPTRTPAEEGLAALLSTLRPGSAPADLRDAYSIGLGVEAPIAPDDVLTSGMTVSVRVEVDGWVRRAIVLVTDDGVEPLVA
ncbi:MAG TPA: M24 family metallopeptidase [Acidimicrobiales bacterium]|nr:M24 family metallopeptidase [Acidimicrobiales bacterium]